MSKSKPAQNIFSRLLLIKTALTVPSFFANSKELNISSRSRILNALIGGRFIIISAIWELI